MSRTLFLAIIFFSVAIINQNLLCQQVTIEDLQQSANQINQDVDNEMGFISILFNIRDLEGHRDSIVSRTQSNLTTFNNNCDDFIKNNAAQKDKDKALAIKETLNERRSPEKIKNALNYSYFLKGSVIFSIPIMAGMFIISKVLEKNIRDLN